VSSFGTRPSRSARGGREAAPDSDQGPELDPEQELATARALVQRRIAATRGLTVDARVRRLAGMLARKGYPAGTAFRVVREALAEEGQDAELGFDELQALDD
jgi:regulatory protein